MKQIDEENLDTAIVVGDTICKTLGICCEKRGQVIHEIYQKLEDLKAKKDTTVLQQSHDAQIE